MKKSLCCLGMLFLIASALFARSSIGEVWEHFSVSVAPVENNVSVDSSTYNAALSDLIFSLEDFMRSKEYRYEVNQNADFALHSRALYNTACQVQKIALDASLDEAELQRTLSSLTISMQAEVIALLRAENRFSSQSGNLYAILVVMLSVLIVAVVVFAVLYARRRRQMSELARAVQNERLITQTIVRVQEDERTRMYRELHDTVAQDIKAAQFFSNQLLAVENQDEKMRSLSEKIDLLQKNCVREIYAVIRNLTPPLLSGDFVKSIEDLCLTTTTFSGIPCKHFIDPAVQHVLSSFADDKKLHVYRIIQEALNNAIRHAHPTEVSLIIRGTKDMVDIFVTDDGTGFDASDEAVGANTFGLRGMKSRVTVLGAELKIVSDKEMGTQIKVTLPIQEVSKHAGGGNRWL